MAGKVRVAWLSGPEGVGKSSLASGIANKCLEQQFHAVHYVDVRGHNHASVTSAILHKVVPHYMHTSVESLSMWSNTLVAPTLLWIDNLDEPFGSDPLIALEWLPVVLSTPPAMIAVIVTSRNPWSSVTAPLEKYVPAPLALAPIEVKPLNPIDAEHLVRLYSAESAFLSQEYIDETISTGVPGKMITQSLQTLRSLSPAPTANSIGLWRDMVKACARLILANRDGPFDTELALHMIGNHNIVSKSPSISTRHLLRLLQEAHMITERLRMWTLVPGLTEIVSNFKPLHNEIRTGGVRMQRVLLIRLKRACALNVAQCPTAAAALVQSSWAHISRTLMRVQFDVSNYSLLAEALVDAESFLAARLSSSEIKILGERLVAHATQLGKSEGGDVTSVLVAIGELCQKHSPQAIKVSNQEKNVYVYFFLKYIYILRRPCRKPSPWPTKTKSSSSHRHWCRTR